MKSLGIIGGCGARAGVAFAGRLIQAAQARGASKDSEFPTFILYNQPFRGSDETGVSQPEDFLLSLLDAVNYLEKCACDLGIIACNSAHEYLDEVEEMRPKNGRVQILNVIQLAADACIGRKKVGVLSSESTKLAGLYQAALKEVGIESVLTTDDEQKALNDVIGAVMAGKESSADFSRLRIIMRRMKGDGAQSVMLACTELESIPVEPILPLVFPGEATINHALDLLKK